MPDSLCSTGEASWFAAAAKPLPTINAFRLGELVAEIAVQVDNPLVGAGAVAGAVRSRMEACEPHDVTTIPRLSFSHMGIFVADLARMEDFYTRVLGFAVTDRGRLGATTIVFLSLDPKEHHQIILATGRPASPPGDVPFNPINQISFRLSELAGLREMARRVAAEGARDVATISHGNALSVYFRDPEGNRLELFVDTPWYVRQPLRLPMDLSLPDEELWAWAEREARKQPDFQPVEDWRRRIAERIG